MKRLRVDETQVKDASGHPPAISTNPTFSGRNLPTTVGPVHRQVLTTQPHNSTPTIAYSSSVKVVEPPGGMQSGLYSTSTVSYTGGAMPSATAPHSGKPQVMQPLPISQHGQLRNKVRLCSFNFLFNLAFKILFIKFIAKILITIRICSD